MSVYILGFCIRLLLIGLFCVYFELIISEAVDWEDLILLQIFCDILLSIDEPHIRSNIGKIFRK